MIKSDQIATIIIIRTCVRIVYYKKAYFKYKCKGITPLQENGAGIHASPGKLLQLLLGNTIFSVEHFNTATCLRGLLLPGKEGMALRADFHVDFLLGRSNYELIPTVTGYLCLIISRLYTFSHFIHLSHIICSKNF